MNCKAISRYRQALFGVSILIVMSFHYVDDISKHMDTAGILHSILRSYVDIFSGNGVDIFAFLSGMGLFFSFSADPDLKNFWIKRFRRVFIPYAVLASVFWIVRDVFIKDKSYLRALQDFLFITLFTKKTVTFWYILYCLVMYLLFPALFFLFTSRKHRNIHFICVLAASYLIPVLCFYLFHDFYE